MDRMDKIRRLYRLRKFICAPQPARWTICTVCTMCTQCTVVQCPVLDGFCTVGTDRRVKAVVFVVLAVHVTVQVGLCVGW